jgi:hypothetical protein
VNWVVRHVVFCHIGAEGIMAGQQWAVAGGVLLGLLAVEPAGRADEATAVQAGEKLGGRVTVDAKQPGKPVVEVDFYNREAVTDAGLKLVKEFKSLRTLVLDGTGVTDAGLRATGQNHWRRA